MDTSPTPSPQQRHDSASSDDLRGTIYTACTLGYDRKPLRCELEPGVKRDVRWAPQGTDPGRDGSLWNRQQKLMHPPTDGVWSVYCDGSLSPKAPLLAEVWRWLEKADVAVFRHPHRSCAYAEIDACVARKKISEQEADQARGTLMLSGFPKDFGLWALGMIVRRSVDNPFQSIVFPMVWEMTKHIVRDQIWFPFALWKIKNSVGRVHTIEGDIFNNKFFKFRRHGT